MIDDVRPGHVEKADEHAAVPDYAGLDDKTFHVFAKGYKSWRYFYRGPKGMYLYINNSITFLIVQFLRILQQNLLSNMQFTKSTKTQPSLLIEPSPMISNMCQEKIPSELQTR